MLVLPLALMMLAGAADAGPAEPWSFPEVTLEVGARLPNLMLPKIEGGAPVALYDLLAGKPTVLHIYASW
jgi:hypothetical protein